MTRNRLRRRSRAIIGQLHAASPIPRGAYLVGGSVATSGLTFPELERHVQRALDQITGASRVAQVDRP
ncbi:MAG: hypothetical protein JJE52_00750 [Acidimicrobiia bacterium]|nr:hypothetical protein [Acidimicrobiia bacterium]